MEFKYNGVGRYVLWYIALLPCCLTGELPPKAQNQSCPVPLMTIGPLDYADEVDSDSEQGPTSIRANIRAEDIQRKQQGLPYQGHVLHVSHKDGLADVKYDDGSTASVSLNELKYVGPIEGLRLEPVGLRYLSSLKSPLYFVPVVGVYRSGKSMLLNRLMGLCSPYANGFGVGHEQDTFTRGILICAEEVQGLGTIVWMDTEGLFSSEETREAYGPKIFSLSLLFGSSVILNNHKVFSESFFKFFDEQQQLARVLKTGLVREGLPSDSLLPDNLSTLWVLQQPVNYDNAGDATSKQLESFLNVGQDDIRARVRESFRHSSHEIPVATFDVRAWRQLDTLTDDKLSVDYIAAVKKLRERVLQELQYAKPRMASNVEHLLKMYSDLVQTQHFSASSAMEVFEQSELSTLCGSFRQTLLQTAGTLPSKHLKNAYAEANASLELQRKKVIQEFHFSDAWSRQLDKCIKDEFAQMENENIELILKRARIEIDKAASEGECHFLGLVGDKLMALEEEYGDEYADSVHERAWDHASGLQRMRLVECLRVRHLLWPLATWLIWPICSIYWRSGYLTGTFSLVVHCVIAFGAYTIAQASGRLPIYLDIDCKLLQRYQALLKFVMVLPPWLPWYGIGQLCAIFGLLFSLWKIIFGSQDAARQVQKSKQLPSRDMADLQQKLEIVFKRTEASFKVGIVSAAVDAAENIEKGEARRAVMALLKGLTVVRTWSEDDLFLSDDISSDLQQRVCDFMTEMELPPPDLRLSQNALSGNQLFQFVVEGDWEKLLDEMLRVLQELCRRDIASCGISPISNAPTSHKKSERASNDDERASNADNEEEGEEEDLRPRNLEATLQDTASSPPSFSSTSRAFALEESGIMSNSPGALSEEGHQESTETSDAFDPSSRRYLLLGAFSVCATACTCAYLFPPDPSSATV